MKILEEANYAIIEAVQKAAIPELSQMDEEIYQILELMYRKMEDV